MLVSSHAIAFLRPEALLLTVDFSKGARYTGRAAKLQPNNFNPKRSLAPEARQSLESNKRGHGNDKDCALAKDGKEWWLA